MIRDRIVTIHTIYDQPKEKKMTDYSFFNQGIKLEDGSYANIVVSGKTYEDVKDKIEEKLTVNGKRIKIGGTYKVYEETTDKDEKYWKVTSFVMPEDPYSAQSTELPKDPILSKLSDEGIAQQERNICGVPKGGGGTPTTISEREERKQILIVRQSALNYATQLATAECIWKGTSVPSVEEMKDKIKEIAKEYEEQVLRK